MAITIIGVQFIFRKYCCCSLLTASGTIRALTLLLGASSEEIWQHSVNVLCMQKSVVVTVTPALPLYTRTVYLQESKELQQQRATATLPLEMFSPFSFSPNQSINVIRLVLEMQSIVGCLLVDGYSFRKTFPASLYAHAHYSSSGYRKRMPGPAHTEARY